MKRIGKPTAGVRQMKRGKTDAELDHFDIALLNIVQRTIC
jgi:hypothetical protein